MLETALKLAAITSTLTLIVPWLLSYKVRYRVKHVICRDEDSNSIWYGVFLIGVGLLSEFVWSASRLSAYEGNVKGALFFYGGMTLICLMTLYKTISCPTGAVTYHELQQPARSN